MKFWLALLIYGLLLAIPVCSLFLFVPIINKAHELNVSLQDITLHHLSKRTKEYFEDYRADIPAVAQKAYLLERFGGESRFGRDRWTALCEWGREIVRDQGGSLDCSETEAVNAAIARLRGTDQKAQSTDLLVNHFKGASISARFQYDMLAQSVYARGVMWFLHIFYPNDDIGYLAFGWQDIWNIDNRVARGPDDEVIGLFVFGGIIFGFALLVQRGMRLLTIRVLGWCLRIQTEPTFRAYDREMFNLRRQLFGYAVVLPLSCALAIYALEPFYVLYFQSSDLLYAAVFWNALIGGILVESLENVVSLLVIRAGYDPHLIIWDNILVIGASIGLLLYFQNSWFSIASAVAIGLVGNLSHKISTWRRAVNRPVEDNGESIPRPLDFRPGSI